MDPERPQPLLCPSCRAPMEKRAFERKIKGTVELELCFSCHAIWFDRYENLQLEPQSIIELFKLIHARSHEQLLPLATRMSCPRCGDPMVPSMDRAKTGAFNYMRCIHQHGHFIVFAQFMIEKGFVRQLSNSEVARIKAAIGLVRCAGCGAPVDIRRDSACPHCQAPIALLDPQAVESALARYQQAAERRNAPPDPLLLGDAIINKQREPGARRPIDETYEDFGDFLMDSVIRAWRSLGE